MRNFSKTLISMAAVMAVGSAMAAGAMAATLSATYSNGKVTIGNVTPGKDQYTLLIVQGEKAAGSSDYSYYAKNTTIKQIDQNDAGVPFTSTTVGTLDEGSYKVLVGNNDGSVDTGYFTVGGTTEPDEPEVPTVETKDFKYGDVDGDTRKRITANDVTCIAKYVTSGASDATKNVGLEETLASDGKTKVKYGDVDGDTRKRITANDVTCVAKFVTSGASDATKSVGDVVKVIK